MKKYVLRALGIFVFLGVCLSSIQPALAESTQYKVCFVEVVDNGAFDLMMDGFKSRMEELGFDNVSYDVKNAQGDQATLNQIASQLKASDYDLIVPIATPAAQACVNANLSHNQVFISVTDPVSAGLLSTMERPDKGITGTSDKTDCAEIYGLAQEIIPDLKDKTLGILYCSGEKNSQVTVGELTHYLDEHNIAYKIKTIMNSSEAQQATLSLAKDCGAIFVPMDSVVQSAMEQVSTSAKDHNVPILGSDPVMVRSGALLSVACGNKAVGSASADLASQLLQGRDVSEVPACTVDKKERVVSTSTAQALGLNLDNVDNIYREDSLVHAESSETPLPESPMTVFLEAGLLGLEYGLLAAGVYITFRILDLADLTVDGSFCLGMAVGAVCALAGHPVLGVILGSIAAAGAGCITGVLIVKADINPLLAGIITMTGLYSINTFVLGGPNLSLIDARRIYQVIGSTTSGNSSLAPFICIFAIDLLVLTGLCLYFKTESGLSMRACGDNEKMCRASSINTNLIKIAGLALSNALVGLSGALVGQYQGFADVSSGTGMIMVGLASVIIGEVFTKNMTCTKGLFLSVVGSVVYRIVIQAALEVDLIDASALKLITAIIVGGFMAIPAIQARLQGAKKPKEKVGTLDEGGAAPQGLLDVRGLGKTFYPGLPMENKVLKDLNLVLDPGDFACVVGSNGAGKSTFFNAVAGSIAPDGGSISICGKDVVDIPDYKRARKLSRVFQDPTQGTAPHLTVAENIALAYGRSCGSSLKFAMRKSRYDFIYEQLKELGFGLEDRMATCVGLLSGGQRQAISLLMATIGDPELLLLDEHTAALDPEATKRIMELTEKIVREKNITCLMITHDLNSALIQGNKCLVMDEGRIVAQINQDQRQTMDVEDLLDMYRKNTGRDLADDKILFAG